MAPLGDTKCIVTVTSEYGQFDGKGSSVAMGYWVPWWVDDVNNALLLDITISVSHANPVTLENWTLGYQELKPSKNYFCTVIPVISLWLDAVSISFQAQFRKCF